MKSLVAERSGSAAIELALVAPILIYVLLNVVDLASYGVVHMEIQNAAEIGGQAARLACVPSNLPATVNCAALTAATRTAVQSTMLGTSVTLQTGSPAEGYYCVDGSNTLVYVGAVTGSKPANCASVGQPTGVPGDYVTVQVNYTFTSLFLGLTIVAALPSTLTATAWVRMS